LYPDELKEVILARGHRNILATHQTTLEITKETCLSKRGNCVIAVSADKALTDLDADFKQNLRREEARLTVTIKAGGIAEKLYAHGSSRLLLTHPADMILRKSSYISNRTLAIQADKASIDLSRKIAEKLRDPAEQVIIELAITI
jgi:hypothetical protein